MATLLIRSLKKETNTRDFTNVAANFSGQIIAILSSLVCLPIIISIVGLEAYGLIAFYTMLLVASAVLDLGLTPALSREISKTFRTLSDLVFIKKYIHSAELILLGGALTCATIAYFAADWLASSWLKVEDLPIDDVVSSIYIMGLLMGLRIFESAYRGVLIGFHEQVILNVILSISAVFRWAGSTALLYFYDPSILLFFVWQAAVSVSTVIALVFYIYFPIRNIKPDAFWSISAFISLWNFSGPMTIQALFILTLTQADKIILSNALTLEDYGYYAIAALFATALVQLTAPVTQTYFAIFSQNTAAENIEHLRASFHLSTQLTVVLSASFTAVLFFFSSELLTLWSSQPDLAQKVAPILSLSVAATFLNVLTHPLYNLGLAYGNVLIFLKINGIAALFFIPGLIFIVPTYGMIGAAWAWLLLNLVYFLAQVTIIFRLFPEFSRVRWLIGDLLPCILVSLVLILLFQLLMPQLESSWLKAAYLIVCLCSILIANFLASSKLRVLILPIFRLLSGP